MGHFGSFLGHFVAFLKKFAESSKFFCGIINPAILAFRMYAYTSYNIEGFSLRSETEISFMTFLVPTWPEELAYIYGEEIIPL